MDCIVPVAASSLKDKHKDTLDLFLNSRNLLRTFTDAQNHIPRHRRTRYATPFLYQDYILNLNSSFFSHLVDVLNPADYLAPVVLLLSDKATSRVCKQDFAEAQSTLALPLSIMQHYDTDTKVSVCFQQFLLSNYSLFAYSHSEKY
jgi:U3 small nucleolar RNA-associated protein 10